MVENENIIKKSIVLPYNKYIHNRRSIRLKGYDYSQSGLYFVTICTKDRVNLFGEIFDGEMILNDYGLIAQKQLIDLPNHFSNIKIDTFCIMPNHIHGIIVIDNDTNCIGANNIATNCIGAQASGAPTLGDIIRAYKSLTVKNIVGAPLACAHDNKPIGKIFQRNYHEHIIRNQTSYETISQYIQQNPSNWQNDSLR